MIFEVKSAEAGKIQTMLQDDIINRQSIVIRDANSLDIKGTVSYLKVEGSAEGLKRAEEFAKEEDDARERDEASVVIPPITPEEKAKALKKIRADEENAEELRK